MKKLITTLSIGTAVLFGGCASEYQKLSKTPHGYFVGYSEQKLGKHKYEISYSGVIGESISTAKEFSKKRAYAVCKEKGFNNFHIANDELFSKLFKNKKKQHISMIVIYCK